MRHTLGGPLSEEGKAALEEKTPPNRLAKNRNEPEPISDHKTHDFATTTSFSKNLKIKSFIADSCTTATPRLNFELWVVWGALMRSLRHVFS